MLPSTRMFVAACAEGLAVGGTERRGGRVGRHTVSYTAVVDDLCAAQRERPSPKGLCPGRRTVRSPYASPAPVSSPAAVFCCALTTAGISAVPDASVKQKTDPCSGSEKRFACRP